MWCGYARRSWPSTNRAPIQLAPKRTTNCRFERVSRQPGAAAGRRTPNIPGAHRGRLTLMNLCPRPCGGPAAHHGSREHDPNEQLRPEPEPARRVGASPEPEQRRRNPRGVNGHAQGHQRCGPQEARLDDRVSNFPVRRGIFPARELRTPVHAREPLRIELRAEFVPPARHMHEQHHEEKLGAT